MKFQSIFIAVLFLILNFSVYSQNVGINDDGSSPDGSAILDINTNSGNKGLLIPRVALTGNNDVTTVSSPATGLMIYNTVTVSGGNAVEPGYYFWDGSGWKVITNTTGNLWTRDFDNGYTYLTNTGDSVGIGVTSPSAKLEVNGEISTGETGIKWKRYTFSASSTGSWTDSGVDIDIDKSKIIAISGAITRSSDGIVKAMGTWNGLNFLVYIDVADNLKYMNNEWPGTANILIYYTD